MTLKRNTKFEEKVTYGLENDMMNLVSFHQSTRKSQMLGLWWNPFVQGRKCMSLKFSRGAMYHDNEECCKIWRGIDLLFQNWQEGFDEFLPKH